MKNKIKDYLTKVLWILILLGLFFIAGTFLSPEVKGAQMEQVDKKPKNKEVRVYHRNAKKNFTCSLCKTKKWYQVWKR